MNTIQDRLAKESWFVISACKGTDNDAAAMGQLKALLAAYNPIEATGVWEGKPEQSLLVFSPDHAEAIKLAKQFDQDAVLTDHALIDCRDGSTTPVNGLIFGYKAERQQGYTKVGNTVFSAKL